MKKFVVFLITLLVITLFSNDIGFYDEPLQEGDQGKSYTSGTHKVAVLFVSYEEDAAYLKTRENLTLTYSEVDTSLFLPDSNIAWPNYFTYKNNQSIEEFLSIHDTLSIYDFLPEAMFEFYHEMSYGRDSVIVDIIKNPDRSDGLWVIENEPNATYLGGTFTDSTHKEVCDSIRNSSLNYRVDDPVFRDSMGYDYICFLYDRFSTNTGQAGSTLFWGTFRQYFSEITTMFAHEFGHTFYGMPDKGYDRKVYPPRFTGYYNSFWTSGYHQNRSLGGFASCALPYDLMFHNGIISNPYALYGINLYHTVDLIEEGVIEDKYYSTLDSNFTDGIFLLKNIRKKLESNELNTNTKNALKIKIYSDNNYSYVNSSGTLIHGEINDEHQFFTIEYRNNTTFDQFSEMYKNGDSKGVLISHNINKQQPDIESPIWIGNLFLNKFTSDITYHIL